MMRSVGQYDLDENRADEIATLRAEVERLRASIAARNAATVTEVEAIAAYDAYRNAVAEFKQHEPWGELATFKKGAWFAVVRMIRSLGHERGDRQ